jgi:2-polyprenyl-6-methoxyphenol hydroxylase-like FAD-dependent oxidoreductase
MSQSEPHAAVVGGSLSGLCVSLALARMGWRVTIIERSTGEPPGGAGLGLDRRLLGQVAGVNADGIPVVSGNRDSAAWAIVRQFLLGVARGTPGVEFMESTTVTGVRDASDISQVALDTAAGTFAADLVVGADGVYSVTRRFVAPNHPDASYAGLYAVARAGERG